MGVQVEASGYWGAIAQVVPVIALALVLETRVLARRWAAEGSDFALESRLVWGAVLTALWVALVFAQGAALFALGFGLPGDAWIWAAGAAVLIGTSAVIIVPIMSVVSAALRDLTFRLGTSVPWSPHRKVLRAIVQFEQSTRLQRLEFRSAKIEWQLMKLSYYTGRPTPSMDALLDAMLEKVFEAIPNELPIDRASMKSAVVSEFEERIVAEEDLATADQGIASVNVSLYLVGKALELAQAMRESALKATSPEELVKLTEQVKLELRVQTDAW